VVAAGVDGDPDLAVVRVSAPNLPCLKLHQRPPNEGDPIVVIGYPYTQLDSQ
jgi:hypothetical protein